MLLPICYDDPVNEYRKLLEDVTLWDVSVERNVEISGPDGARFAELLTPRDPCEMQGRRRALRSARRRRRAAS
jgi:aminomethyltransferase